ncbi:histidine kinase [Arenibacter sp. F26102]|uniref:sensor histidine kinase n=1 Tax=Arenibacter sp. F26102 TaxID=2926416 RepID=UPI001FF11E4C|nr:histidine kinase [Arenibacter sp. F26102]MCK0147630.1 histidine kinase [Arenibacter sp. F26102]
MATLRRFQDSIPLRIVGLHLVFWALIVTYFAWGFGFNENPKMSFINSLYFLPGHIIMVYSLLYFLVPKFLLKNKFLHFFVGLLVVLLFCILYTILAQLQLSSDIDSFKGMTLTVGRNVLPFLHVAGIALSIKLLKYWYLQRKRTIEAEQQKTVAELKLLKAQLHPHFLFNTLNNLYSHTLESSPRSPEIVMKLSGLLRFMIYESNVPKISLLKEIELLQNYISLEELRYGERLDLSLTINGDIGKYQIAPLLLLPFLENAFKHGTSRQIETCWISFHLSMDGSTMSFKLVNSIDPGEAKTRIGGLGLQNVRQRLELLYKHNHTLETVMLEEVFVVSLEINLEELEKKYEDELVLTLSN